MQNGITEKTILRYLLEKSQFWNGHLQKTRITHLQKVPKLKKEENYSHPDATHYHKRSNRFHEAGHDTEIR